jgi:hypothetical protein
MVLLTACLLIRHIPWNHAARTITGCSAYRRSTRLGLPGRDGTAPTISLLDDSSMLSVIRKTFPVIKPLQRLVEELELIEINVQY